MKPKRFLCVTIQHVRQTCGLLYTDLELDLRSNYVARLHASENLLFVDFLPLFILWHDKSSILDTHIYRQLNDTLYLLRTRYLCWEQLGPSLSGQIYI